MKEEENNIKLAELTYRLIDAKLIESKVYFKIKKPILMKVKEFFLSVYLGIKKLL